MNSDLDSGYVKCIGIVAWGSCAYPALLLLSIYTTWAIAWCVLGHQPRPSLDDPDSISRAVSFFRLMAYRLLLFFYLALLFNGSFVFAEFAQRLLHKRGTSIWFVTIPVLLWLLTAALLSLDPGNVFYWFAD